MTTLDSRFFRLTIAGIAGVVLSLVACSKDKKTSDKIQSPAPTEPAPTEKVPSTVHQAADATSRPIDAAPPLIDAAAPTTQPTDATPDDSPTNLVVLPKTWSTARVKREMKTWSRALGVKCKYCHQGKDYAADTKDDKAAARKMVLMTKAMNRRFFGKSKKKLTCATCHQGSAVPKQ